MRQARTDGVEDDEPRVSEPEERPRHEPALLRRTGERIQPRQVTRCTRLAARAVRRQDSGVPFRTHLEEVEGVAHDFCHLRSRAGKGKFTTRRVSTGRARRSSRPSLLAFCANGQRTAQQKYMLAIPSATGACPGTRNSSSSAERLPGTIQRIPQKTPTLENTCTRRVRQSGFGGHSHLPLSVSGPSAAGGGQNRFV